jgi:outer membrane lipopolysaccharide assembly protein LptE/RlpB
MIKKIIISLIIISFTANCGFTPIYSSKENNYISIEQLNFSGDRIFNNYLRSNLSKYKNNVSPKKIYLDIETIYQKNVLSTNASGEISKYELVVEAIFTVNSNNQKLKFKESKIMENMNNKSDERDYENSTKQTFANIITNDLIGQLVTIKLIDIK